MREILFKGKKKDNGEWIEGYLLDGGMPGEKRIFIGKLVIGKWTIMADEFDEVDPDTICEYTGLTDKNGKKIWENDIVELPDEEGYFTCEWEEDAARFVMNGDGLTVNFDNYWSYQTEVAGNIFDNPELLEVE